MNGPPAIRRSTSAVEYDPCVHKIESLEWSSKKKKLSNRSCSKQPSLSGVKGTRKNGQFALGNSLECYYTIIFFVQLVLNAIA